MNNTDYLRHTAIDFSTDPYFLEWRWLQTEETSIFWEGFLERYPEKKDDILLAIEIVASFREYKNDTLFSESDKRNAVRRLSAEIHRYKRRQKRTFFGIGTFVLLGSLFFLPFRQVRQIEPVVQIPTIVTENKEVQLILSSGEKSKFDEDIQIKYNSVGNIVVESKSGEMLETHEIEIEPAQLNKLIVPRGKRSSMLLADGSRIWVNSGTTVEFPSTFSQKERRISVDGEIYIEVANDPQKPFHVSTKDFDVVVLGTTFNVTAYSKDELQHITVAEGLVSVFTKDAEEGSLISRNQQLRVINGQGVEISNVDVYNYTSWHEGILRFESEPLPQILTRLSRYYDINMLFSDDVQSIRCSGKLYLFDEWQVVLDNITIVTPVKYSIQDNNIEFYHSK
jgi:hypothetical protein